MSALLPALLESAQMIASGRGREFEEAYIIQDVCCEFRESQVILSGHEIDFPWSAGDFSPDDATV